MRYSFEIVPVPSGAYKIVVRCRDGSLLLASTPLHDTARATIALERLRDGLSSDWRYRILTRRKGGPSFVIALSDPAAACVSKEFSSCDAMEREIGRLKAAAQTTEPKWLEPCERPAARNL